MRLLAFLHRSGRSNPEDASEKRVNEILLALHSYVDAQRIMARLMIGGDKEIDSKWALQYSHHAYDRLHNTLTEALRARA